jgi:hypothetical protein
VCGSLSNANANGSGDGGCAPTTTTTTHPAYQTWLKRKKRDAKRFVGRVEDIGEVKVKVGLGGGGGGGEVVIRIAE